MSVRKTLRRPGWLKTEVLAGLVVALALIPEAIAFSLIAGVDPQVDPQVGLYAASVTAISIAFLGGRPAMISAAAATALVVAPVGPATGCSTCLPPSSWPASSRSCWGRSAWRS